MDCYRAPDFLLSKRYSIIRLSDLLTLIVLCEGNSIKGVVPTKLDMYFLSISNSTLYDFMAFLRYS